MTVSLGSSSMARVDRRWSELVEQAAEKRSLKGEGKREKGEIVAFSLIPFPFSPRL
jgi:hypothetical protein